MTPAPRVPRDTVTIGGSAGGIEALIALLGGLPSGLPVTIGVVIHRSTQFPSQLRDVISRYTTLPVSEPEDDELIKTGHVYLAPRDFHMMIQDDHWRVTRGPRIHRMRPAVDPLFFSAAEARGNRVVGVLLSGGDRTGWRV